MISPRPLFLATALLTLAAPICPAPAEVRLPKIFGDHMVLQRDKPVRIWGWAEAGEEVSVQIGAARVSGAADEGGRWSLSLPAQEATGEPLTLTVKGANEIVLKDILVGEVWLCSGQSNMEWPMKSTEHGAEEIPKADRPQIRLFNVMGHISRPEPQDDAPGQWQRCTPETVVGFSGVGYHFGQALRGGLDVPVGLVGSNWGGTKIEPWTPKVGLEQVASLTEGATDGGIYNGMIHPLAPLSLRGILWYQGESNCVSGDAAIYTDRTRALVLGWRTVFEQEDLPFYFVQLAPFRYTGRLKKRNPGLNAESLPRIWDAQAACLDAIENTGMAVITDVTGNVDDIHPRNKRDVGQRLARLALAKTYGKEGLVATGPVFKSHATGDGKVLLSFEYGGGKPVSLDGAPLTHFLVAGADRAFKPAAAEIMPGGEVGVSSPEVPEPVAVRFAWDETAIANFGSEAGDGTKLPAAPFRTDDW